MATLQLTHIGGPTLLIDWNGLRLITDPTFSPPGEYPSGALTLTKKTGPALSAAQVGSVDAVLLTHDQHADNLDPAGRDYLAGISTVLTTVSGAQRLGRPAIGLAPWEEHRVGDARVVATPARHGPAGSEPLVGDVVGFTIGTDDEDLIYLTGDTVYYDGVRDVAQSTQPKLVVAFAGAARTRGPFDLTMNTNDVLELAAVFPAARIAVIHAEGWAHFTETFDDVRTAFAVLKREERLLPLTPGIPAILRLD